MNRPSFEPTKTLSQKIKENSAIDDYHWRVNKSLPRGYNTWEDYRNKTGDWSIGPGVTYVNPNFFKK